MIYGHIIEIDLEFLGNVDFYILSMHSCNSLMIEEVDMVHLLKKKIKLYIIELQIWLLYVHCFFFLKKTDILKIITNRRAIIYLIKVFNILAAYPKRKGKYILVTSCIKMRANQRIVSLC